MQDYELSEILEQYDFTVNSTRKTRGAVLCDTAKGLMLLKEVPVLKERMDEVCRLYEHLGQQEGMMVDCPEKNASGEYVTKSPCDKNYVMKRWVQGRECDIHRSYELMGAAKNLARLHMVMKGETLEKIPKAPYPAEEYERHNRELKQVRKFIRNVSPKGEFERIFLNKFEDMFSVAERAKEQLYSDRYKKLYAQALDHKSIVHQEYNYHNIIVSQEGIMTTNFERCRMYIQMEDLYYFLRKSMEKLGWKVKAGNSVINAYCSIRQVSDEEVRYLQNRLSYPEKFWKIANAYQRSNKAWVSKKNVQKLCTAIQQSEEKKVFIREIFYSNL